MSNGPVPPELHDQPELPDMPKSNLPEELKEEVFIVLHIHDEIDRLKQNLDLLKSKLMTLLDKYNKDKVVVIDEAGNKRSVWKSKPGYSVKIK